MAAEAGPLLDKALQYSAVYQANHTPAFGCSLRVEFESEGGPILTYHQQGDSCAWTGYYVAAESYRYRVTGDPDARSNVIKSLGCLLALEAVTGKPGFVARFVGPAAPPFLGGPSGCLDAQDCHVLGAGPFAGNYWIGNTSKDQYLGWFYGMAHAHEFVLTEPGDAALRAEVEGAVARVVDTTRADGYMITDPDGTVSTKGPEIFGHYALAFHLVAAATVGGPYAAMMPQIYAEQLLSYLVLTNYSTFRYLGNYFNHHLGHLAQHMTMRYEPDPVLHKAHQSMHRQRLYRHVRDTGQTFYDYIAWGEAGYAATPEQIAGAKQVLTEFAPAPRRDLHPDQGPWEPDPAIVEINALFTLLNDLFGADLELLDLAPANPWPMAKRCVNGFIWQHRPWEVCPPSRPLFENDGADYLIAYWLGRYHGFLDATD